MDRFINLKVLAGESRVVKRRRVGINDLRL